MSWSGVVRLAVAVAVVIVGGWAYWAILSASPPMSGGTIAAGAVVIGGALVVWALVGDDEL